MFFSCFVFVYNKAIFFAPKEYLKETPSMKIYSGADLHPSEKSTINVSSKLNPGHHFVYTLYVSMIVPWIKCTLISKKKTFSLFIFTAREDAFYKHLITLILWPRCFEISLSEVLGIFSETSK